MSYENIPPSFFQVNPLNSLKLSAGEKFYSKSDFEKIYKNVDKSIKDMSLYDESFSKQRKYEKILCGTQSQSPFSRLYFSNENIEEIQKLLKYHVYLNTDKRHIIGRQSEQELIIIMKSVFLQYSKNPENKECFKKEISRLNSIVVSQSLPYVISNIEQHIGYIKDSSELYSPIDRPTSQSNTGTKINRSVSDVLFDDSIFFS
jgi:hypothetical protein